MNDLTRSLGVSASGLAAQSLRLRLAAENLANADTPGFRRKLAAFEPDGSGGVRAGDMTLDPTALPRIHDPAHPMADAAGYYDGSNVSTMVEIADAREAQRSYEANLKMFEGARAMAGSLLDLLRR